MQRIIPALAAVALISPVLAKADDVHFPPRKPGLWEMTMKAGPATITNKQCVDHATDAALMMRGFAAIKKMGGTMSITGGGGEYQVKSVATVQGHTISTTETVKFIGDTAITSKGHTHVAPPFPGMENSSDSDASNDSKWIGPCPPDLQPGQAVINGRTVDLMKAEPANH